MAFKSQSLKTYDVQIGGVSLVLKSDHQPEKVEKLIQFVESKVANSIANNSNVSMQKALILSCLNLAEDYVNLKESARNQINQMESKILSLMSILESSKKQKTQNIRA